MKNLLLWSLVGLNALLLMCFIGRITGQAEAVAQVRGGGGNAGAQAAGGGVAGNVPTGDYLLIPASITGVNGDMVFIVDTRNNWLSAMVLDESRNELATMPRIDLDRIWESTERAPQTPVRRGTR